MSRNRWYEIGVGCLLVAALLVFGFMAVEIGAIRSFAPTVTVTARFGDAAGLDPGARVAVAGVEVGRVDHFDLDGDVAVATLEIREDARIPKDARVRVRQKSLLGEKYVELDPGTQGGPLLADGDVVPVDGTQVEIDELLSRLGPAIEAMDSERTRAAFARLAERLEGDPELLPRLIENLDKTLQNAADASEDVDDLVTEGRTTLAVARRSLAGVADRADEAEALLQRANGTLGKVDATLDRVPALADKVELLLDDGRVVTGRLKSSADKADIVLDNLGGIDELALRRLMREEGILVRIVPREVDPEAKPGEFKKKGRVK